MGKGWLPVLEVGSLGDAGGVGPRGLNHLRGLFGNGVLGKEKVLLWSVVLERGPRKGRVASATEALLSPGDNPKWMELFGEGWLPILENAGCGASGPRPQMRALGLMRSASRACLA